MGVFDHWHPIVPSRKLRRKPVAATLCGQSLALFRTRSGQVGVLDDACPHRRMRLSMGKVVGERLMCKYHGWTFGCDGAGESPGTPKMQTCASTWEAREELGYVWVKSRESSPVFPRFDVEGWCWMCNTEHIAKAPLELTLDNFCEIEHTPTTHDLFGYDLDRMKDVTVRCETTDSSVTVVNHGPAKPINFIYRFFIGIKKHYQFNDTWTTYFSPVHSVYDHSWFDPNTGKEATVKWRVYVFFTPVHDMETRVTAFTFAKSAWWVPPHGGLLAFRGLMRRKVRREINLDVNILHSLASYDPRMEGMKLSRFDKALMLNRERIESVYRGNGTHPDRTRRIASGE